MKRQKKEKEPVAEINPIQKHKTHLPPKPNKYLPSLNFEQTAKAQWADVETGPILRAMEHDSLALLKYSMQGYFISPENLLLKKVLIVKKGRMPESKVMFVVPSNLRERVLYQCHDAQTSGHMGYEKTLARTKDLYLWPGMAKDVKRYCEACLSCNEHRKPLKKAPVQQMPPVERAFQRVGLDVLGPLPVTDQGNKYIVVFTDYLTKNVEAFPEANQTTDTVISLLVNEVISHHGVCEELRIVGVTLHLRILEDYVLIWGLKRCSPPHIILRQMGK